MLDSRIRPLIDRSLAVSAERLATAGVTANQLTGLGLVLGLAAAAAIAMGWIGPGCVLFLAGRVADGLDGAVARRTHSVSDLGGYLDIVVDFIVYAAIPLGFALYDPSANALAAAFLLATIVVNGSAFLAFAIMAAKRRLTTAAQGAKSLFYLAGLAEGTETTAFYVAFCLWPQHFAVLAGAFASLCFLSACGRIASTAERLGNAADAG